MINRLEPPPIKDAVEFDLRLKAYENFTLDNGVPVYVLYAPGKAPLLLPEILSQRIVIDALNTL